VKKKEALSENAVKHFLDGYNCAQSVLLTLSECWESKNELIPKIATGFGSGIGRCGSICGALTGGVMAIGTKYGTNQPSAEERRKCYELSQQLYRRFEKKHGSTSCRKLIDYDLSNPKELEKAKKANVFEKKCLDYIRTVIEILTEFDKP